MYDMSDLSGHHQAHWFLQPEAGVFHRTLADRLGSWLHDLLWPRPEKEGRDRVIPGEPISKVGAGYNVPYYPRCRRRVEDED